MLLHCMADFFSGPLFVCAPFITSPPRTPTLELLYTKNRYGIICTYFASSANINHTYGGMPAASFVRKKKASAAAVGYGSSRKASRQAVDGADGESSVNAVATADAPDAPITIGNALIGGGDTRDQRRPAAILLLCLVALLLVFLSPSASPSSAPLTQPGPASLHPRPVVGAATSTEQRTDVTELTASSPPCDVANSDSGVPTEGSNETERLSKAPTTFPPPATTASPPPTLPPPPPPLEGAFLHQTALTSDDTFVDIDASLATVNSPPLGAGTSLKARRYAWAVSKPAEASVPNAKVGGAVMLKSWGGGGGGDVLLSRQLLVPFDDTADAAFDYPTRLVCGPDGFVTLAPRPSAANVSCAASSSSHKLPKSGDGDKKSPPPPLPPPVGMGCDGGSGAGGSEQIISRLCIDYSALMGNGGGSFIVSGIDRRRFALFAASASFPNPLFPSSPSGHGAAGKCGVDGTDLGIARWENAVADVTRVATADNGAGRRPSVRFDKIGISVKNEIARTDRSSVYPFVGVPSDAPMLGRSYIVGGGGADGSAALRVGRGPSSASRSRLVPTHNHWGPLELLPSSVAYRPWALSSGGGGEGSSQHLLRAGTIHVTYWHQKQYHTNLGHSLYRVLGMLRTAAGLVRRGLAVGGGPSSAHGGGGGAKARLAALLLPEVSGQSMGPFFVPLLHASSLFANGGVVVAPSDFGLRPGGTASGGGPSEAYSAFDGAMRAANPSLVASVEGQPPSQPQSPTANNATTSAGVQWRHQTSFLYRSPEAAAAAGKSGGSSGGNAEGSHTSAASLFTVDNLQCFDNCVTSARGGLRFAAPEADSTMKEVIMAYNADMARRWGLAGRCSGVGSGVGPNTFRVALINRQSTRVVENMEVLRDRVATAYAAAYPHDHSHADEAQQPNNQHQQHQQPNNHQQQNAFVGLPFVVEVVELEVFGPAMAPQAAAFFCADVVVAVHGAALAWAVAMRTTETAALVRPPPPPSSTPTGPLTDPSASLSASAQEHGVAPLPPKSEKGGDLFPSPKSSDRSSAATSTLIELMPYDWSEVASPDAVPIYASLFGSLRGLRYRQQHLGPSPRGGGGRSGSVFNRNFAIEEAGLNAIVELVMEAVRESKGAAGGAPRG